MSKGIRKKSGQPKQVGATVIEYALIAGLIAVALVVALGALGDGVGELFNDAATALTGGGEEG